MIVVMEYPNKNLLILLDNEAKRIARDSFLFGDTLTLAPPSRYTRAKALLKTYKTKVRQILVRA